MCKNNSNQQSKDKISLKADVFARRIIQLEHNGFEQLTYFAKNNFMLAHDNDYWCVLGTIWKSNGSSLLQPLFLELFRNTKRRNKNKIMKASERRFYKSLPSQVTAYRSCLNESEIESAISWSLDKSFVEKYHKANNRKLIASKVFSKDDIFAYFNRRNESEILVGV